MGESEYTISPPPDTQAPSFTIKPPVEAATQFSIKQPAEASQPQQGNFRIVPPESDEGQELLTKVSQTKLTPEQLEVINHPTFPQWFQSTLENINKYAVEPFESLVHKGAEEGGKLGRETYALATGATPSPEGIEKVRAEHPTGAGISSGVGSFIGGQLVDPRNYPLFFTGSAIARPILQRLMSGGFGLMMGKGAIDQSKQLGAQWDNISPEQRAEGVTSLILSAGMTGLAGGHALSPRPTAPVNQAETQVFQADLANRRLALLDTLPPERKVALLQKAGLLPEDANVEDMLPQSARAEGGRLQIGADVGRLTSILGSSMYSNRGAPVVVKELLQNSLDAVRENNGKVEAHLDEVGKTFTIRDTGKGMSPDEVYTVFTDIGASGKGDQADASGGFGLAKIAPFMIPDKLTLRTIGVDEQGQKWLTEFTSSPEDIVSGQVNPKIQRVANDTPTGTTIKTSFPIDKPGEYDKMDFYGAKRFLHAFLGSSNIPGEGIKFTGGHHASPYPLEPLREPINQRLFTLQGPGAEYEFSVGKSKEKGSNWPDYEVHNQGLYQFVGNANVPGGEQAQLPSHIVVNIKPNVKEGHNDYPFSTSRETISKQASDFVNKAIADKIVRPQIDEAVNLIKAKYNSMPTIETADGSSMPIYDSGARLTPQELKLMQSQPVMKDLAGVINSVSKALQEKAGKLSAMMFQGSSTRKMGATIDRYGLLFADTIGEGEGGRRTYGVYVPDPHDPTNHATVFINPFGWAALAGEGAEHAISPSKFVVDPHDAYSEIADPDLFHNPDFAASQIYHTITHELVHDAVKGHNESFTTALMNLDSFMGLSSKVKGLEDIANAFRDPSDPDSIRADFNELLQIYRESRGRPENEKDILGGESLASGPEQPEQRGQAPSAPNAQERGEEVIRADSLTSRGAGDVKADINQYPNAPSTGGQASQGAPSADELRSKLAELVSIIPHFPIKESEKGGVTGGERAASASREGIAPGAGAGDANESRPPTISKAVDEDLLKRGIQVVERGKDMWLTGRLLGGLAESARLLDKQGHPLGSLLRSIAGTMSDVVKAISRNQTDTMRTFTQQAKKLVSREEWSDTIVRLMDDPEISPSKRPSGISDNIWNAYKVARGLDEKIRIGIRNSKRQELALRGVDPKLAAEWIPDDWGITEGHYHHSFPGTWTITKLSDIDEKGNENYVPIETGWRAESKFAAQDKAVEYLKANPNEQIKIEQDTITLPGKNLSDLSALRDITKQVKAASQIIAKGGDADEVIKQIYAEAAPKAFGEKQPARRQFGAALQRESNLPGWVRDRDNFERYLLASERYIQLAPARQILLKSRNQIASLAGLPEVQRIGDMPSSTGYFQAKQYGNILARVDSALEGLEGHPGAWDAATRYTLNGLGLDPNTLSNIFRPMQAVTALLKLGLNPARVLSHGLQTIWGVYPVLGEKATLQGIAHSFDPNYEWLVKDLAIPHGMNATELEGLHSYIGDYFGKGSGPIDWTKGTASILKDVGMLPFAMGIDFTRRVGAIGAYIQGIERGLPGAQARNYARDVMDRTSGSYSPSDNSTLTRQLPAPVAQFKGFMLKTSQFIWGLRTPSEISRFMIAVGVLGYAGLPFLRSFSNLIQDVTGEDIENDLKRAFPKASRGLFGLAGVDVPAGVGLGDLSIGHTGAPLGGLAGPAASDAIAVGSALIHIAGGPGRKADQELGTALRNISPEARRLYDEGLRIVTKKPDLIDPRTNSIIIKNLTPTERIEMINGITPLRVAQERESHEYIRNEIDKYKDKRGYFVDHLAEVEVSLSNPKLSENDRMDLVKSIVSLSKQAQEYGVSANLPKAVRERAREMQMERLYRDVKKAPKAERFPAYQEMQKYKIENPVE